MTLFMSTTSCNCHAYFQSRAVGAKFGAAAAAAAAEDEEE